MESLLAADRAAFVLVNSTLSHPWLDVFFPAITDLHKTWFIAVVAGFVAWSFWRVYRARGIALFGMLLVTLAISDGTATHLFKKNFQRLRPAVAGGLPVVERAPTAGERSFPSNHATNTFALATFTAFFVAGTGPMMFAIAALVAYSRVYCGAHYPSDVLFGALLGSLIGYLLARLSALIVGARTRKTA